MLCNCFPLNVLKLPQQRSTIAALSPWHRSANTAPRWEQADNNTPISFPCQVGHASVSSRLLKFVGSSKFLCGREKTAQWGADKRSLFHVVHILTDPPTSRSTAYTLGFVLPLLYMHVHWIHLNTCCSAGLATNVPCTHLDRSPKGLKPCFPTFTVKFFCWLFFFWEKFPVTQQIVLETIYKPSGINLFCSWYMILNERLPGTICPSAEHTRRQHVQERGWKARNELWKLIGAWAPNEFTNEHLLLHAWMATDVMSQMLHTWALHLTSQLCQSDLFSTQTQTLLCWSQFPSFSQSVMRSLS